MTKKHADIAAVICIAAAIGVSLWSWLPKQECFVGHPRVCMDARDLQAIRDSLTPQQREALRELQQTIGDLP
jgi:hypothetical protein